MKDERRKTKDERWGKAFTLIELLVVIAIIVLLMSIILPALKSAKDRARRADTTAEMKGLSDACEAYQAQFGSYPGIFAEATISASHTSPSTSCISGTQNLMIGLLGAITGSPGTPTSNMVGTLTYPCDSSKAYAQITINGSAVAYVNPPPFTAPSNPAPKGSIGCTSTGPIDNANSVKQYSQFFAPRSGDITTNVTGTWPSTTPTIYPYSFYGATTVAAEGKAVLPTIVDHFADPLPILYYRNSNASTTILSSGPTTSAAFYSNCNQEYTDATALQSPSGATFNESTGSLISTNSTATSTLGGFCTNGATGAAYGGFVLIAAGSSRIYGNIGAATTNDTIVVTGGQ